MNIMRRSTILVAAAAGLFGLAGTPLAPAQTVRPVSPAEPRGGKPKQAGAADLVLYHGKIFTADAARPWAEAIAIRSDRVVAVGSDDAVSSLIGKGTRRVDLGGRTVIPGINDAHDHIMSPPLGVAFVADPSPEPDPTLSALTEVLRKAAQSAPPGAWLHSVVGPGLIRGSGPDVRTSLDQAARDHPVLLQAYWGHGVLLNSRGLQALGIADAVKDPPGGHYERDAAGMLTGKLEEYAGWRAQRRLYTAIPDDEFVVLLRAYADTRLRAGVTSVQFMMDSLDLVRTSRILKKGNLPLRLRAVTWPMPDVEGALPAPMRPQDRHPSPLTTISGTKWVLDGTPNEGLAFRKKPYAGRPGWYGRLNFPKETLRKILAQALASKEQVLFHVVGDATADVVLTEMEALAPAERWKLRRVRLEHANGITGPNVGRASRLGVVIAQPRMQSAPWKTWVSGGIVVAYGSDSMPNAFEVLRWATTSPSRPGEAISREDAVVMMTHGGAYSEFAEKEKGRLAPGMMADLAVLSQDVFTVPAGDLPRTGSVLTIVGGKAAYDAGVLKGEVKKQ